MLISDPKIVARLSKLDVELRHGVSLAQLTSLGIGGSADLLRINKHEGIPYLLRLLDEDSIPRKFLEAAPTWSWAAANFPRLWCDWCLPQPAAASKGK